MAEPTIQIIKPMPHDEHVREHMENGDFSRWAREARARQKKVKEDKEKASKPEPESGDNTGDQPTDNKPAGTTEPKPSPKPPDTKSSTNPTSRTGSRPRPGMPRFGSGKPRPQDDGDERALEDAITIETLIEDILIGSLL